MSISSNRSTPRWHVAAMPFPAVQGTQALLAQMLRTLAAAGESPCLLTYGSGAERAAAEAFAVERIADNPKLPSLRSGPSWRKLCLDVRLALQLQRLRRRNGLSGGIVAHHVEAAMAAVIAGVRLRSFVAHTSLHDELPSYFARPWTPLLRRSGRLLDGWLAARAEAVAAVAPDLCRRLTQQLARPVRYLVPPWPLARAVSAEERLMARQRLHLQAKQNVLLYAGNLDAYQGCEAMIAALQRLRRRQPQAVLWVATASDAGLLRRQAAAAGVGEALRFGRLDQPHQRRLAYAAADLALVPRRALGGVPVKLLEALAHGLPTVLSARASAGLAVGGCTTSVPADDADAWATALHQTLQASAAKRLEHASAARRYIAEEHSAARFLASYVALFEPAATRPSRPFVEPISLPAGALATAGAR